MESTEPKQARKKVLLPRNPTLVAERMEELKAPLINRTRGYVIKITPTGLFVVAVDGGGVVPLPIRGKFTHRKYAQVAIDKYVATLPKDLRPINVENSGPSNS